MKKYILFLLVIVSANAMAQKKGDNTIILPYTSLSQIKNVLFQNGYSTNSDTVYIATSSKELAKAAMSVKLMILRTDTATFIKGMTKSTVSLYLSSVKYEDDFSQISFIGMKGSSYRKVWEEMDRIAKLLSSNLIYIKQ